VTYRSYDITPDGKKFVMVVTGRNESNAAIATEARVVLNWSEELKQRLQAR